MKRFILGTLLAGALMVGTAGIGQAFWGSNTATGSPTIGWAVGCQSYSGGFYYNGYKYC